MIAKISTDNEGTKYLKFFCPGCKQTDSIPIERAPGIDGKIWEFTGTTQNPTLKPSVRQFFPEHDGIPERTTCHYVLTNGIMHFQQDCEHELKGQNIPLPELPKQYHEQ